MLVSYGKRLKQVLLVSGGIRIMSSVHVYLYKARRLPPAMPILPRATPSSRLSCYVSESSLFRCP